MYPVIRKSDKIIVPKKVVNKVIRHEGGGASGGKGFD